MSDEIKDELEEAELKPLTVNDEINDFNKEVLGQPESPLVVHRKGDASYEDTGVSNQMNETHTAEERPTLTRHRFRKEQKGHGKSIIVLFIIVILAAVFAALYFTGNITFNKETTTQKKVTTTEATTSVEEKFKGTIVVKDVYIFVDGKEVDGIEGLQKALEYETPSTTAYKIIDEHANSDFLNDDVLDLLTQMQFYDENTETEHIASTGLIAEAETTTLPPETTTKKKNTKKTKSKKKQTTNNNG